MGLGENGEEISKEKKERLMDTDNSMVIAKGKCKVEGGRRGKRGINGDKRRLDVVNTQHNIQMT